MSQKLVYEECYGEEFLDGIVHVVWINIVLLNQLG